MSKPIINVTPLIDVLLVLLIIFMVVTPLKPHRFETRVPSEPPEDVVDTHPDTIIVTIQRDSYLAVNQETGGSVESPEPVILALTKVFREREANRNDQRTVFIKAPKSLAYGSVANVVVAVKAAGARPISLQIDRLD
jgi:biopolymer transport protein ExbD